jgi:deoxyinosine 3'endonuclease (endonuclease V)
MADERLIAEWQELQRAVASKVVERASSGDADVEESLPISFGAKEGDAGHTCTTNGGRFEYLPLQIDAFAHPDNDDSPRMYGGVDVSFAPDAGSDRTRSQASSAVAVYVVLRRRFKSSGGSSSSSSSSSSKQRTNGEILSDHYELIYSDSIFYEPNVPYLSGYLAFREIEPLHTLVQRQLELKPECTPRVIFVDGNGILHPRRAGIACFLGVRTGIPTIGIGKNLCCVEDGWTVDEAETAIALGLRDAALATPETMTGSSYVAIDKKAVSFDGEDYNPETRGSVPSMKESAAMLAPTCRGYAVNLRALNGKLLGAALVGHGGRSRGNHGKPTSNPIYVSVGHRISLKEAIVLCTKLSNSRIPEPVRFADLLGRKMMRESNEDNSQQKTRSIHL